MVSEINGKAYHHWIVVVGRADDEVALRGAAGAREVRVVVEGEGVVAPLNAVGDDGVFVCHEKWVKK